MTRRRKGPCSDETALVVFIWLTQLPLTRVRSTIWFSSVEIALASNMSESTVRAGLIVLEREGFVVRRHFPKTGYKNQSTTKLKFANKFIKDNLPAIGVADILK